MQIEKEIWGVTSQGIEIECYTLTNQQQMQAKIITLGGNLISLKVPNHQGSLTDVVLGYDTVEQYEKQDKYIGALIGRCSNRIANANFTLNGKSYSLYNNNGKNHLHGGKVGFDKKIWQAQSTEDGLKLRYRSEDGEEGYPGTLAVEVTYVLQEDNTLRIDYKAVSDADTICNLTNHTYFNLSGYDSGSIENQRMQLFASHYTVADAESLPNGRIAAVAGTPLDFTRPVKIGAHIEDDFEALHFAGGFDHNWVIDGYDGTLRKTAQAYAEDTGIEMTMYTTLPGVQFYSGNYLNDTLVGKNGAKIDKRYGFCLESQYFPNALHNPNFKQPILKKGDVYHAQTAYQFK